MNSISEHIKLILSVIPEKPGCYQYFDDKGTIIYVGKAKNLKRRVSSYFNKEHDSNKTRVLVKQIRDIKYIVVNTEEDALLLENNLIKRYRPRYNVLLKDDKTYPSIVIKNEYFPRVFQTRNIVRDGSQYYGPYPSVYTAKIMLQLIKELYPIRTCKYPLTPESIKAGKYKNCLEYHIKRCKAPCEGLQTQEEYLQNISEITSIPAMIILDAGDTDDFKGLEICKQLRENADYNRTKLIVTSSIHDKELVLSAGADLYIPKPYEISNLIQWVQKLFRD